MLPVSYFSIHLIIMFYLSRAALVVSCILVSVICVSQKTDSAYTIYQQQFIDLSTTRSVSRNEAEEILRKFNSYNISSNADMARLLNSLYPKDKGIGVLLYLYHNDTLRRCFFEPGKIIEETAISITANEMYRLGEVLQSALELQNLTANRQPKERGITINSPKASKKTEPLDSVIARLTRILLPAQFDERFKHIVIIPSLNIGTLPFHLLKPYKDGTYLIDKCSFTVAPTLIDFVGLRMKMLLKLSGENIDGTRGTGIRSIMNERLNTAYEGYTGEDIQWEFKNALFVSNPAYPQNSKYFFPDLPGASREVDSVKSYFENAVVYRGKEAIKPAVIRDMNGKEMAYFATHGVSSPDNPKDNSYIVLSGDDPFLTSKQIMDLRFDTGYRMPELVVLSACQTGLGKSMEAGVSGSLARSFILAGTNHVVTSLWSVDDESTAYLMTRFIYHLKQSHMFTPAAPLRLAVLDTKNKFPNPAHWASFILLGTEF